MNAKRKYLSNKIQQQIMNEEGPFYYMGMHIKKKQLKEHYSSRTTALIGIKDGMVIAPSLSYQKYFLEYIRDMLSKEPQTIPTIDAFFRQLTSADWVDRLLKTNLDTKEIKFLHQEERVQQLTRKYGVLGKIGYLDNTSPSSDCNITKIGDVIRNLEEPIVLYATSSIKDLTKNAKISKFKQDPSFTLVENNIQKIEQNLYQILYLNNRTDIIVLNGNSSKRKSTIDDNLAKEYNNQLKQLCKKISVSYINCDVFYQRYHYKPSQILIAEKIIDCLYNQKMWTRQERPSFMPIIGKREPDSFGLKAILDEMSEYYYQTTLEDETYLEELEEQMDIVRKAYQKNLNK